MHYAVCNEMFGTTEFERAMGVLRTCGFEGAEIAPHTIFGDFAGSMSQGTTRIRNALQNEDLRFAGLHWLLVGPSGLHATSPDRRTWQRTWDHVARLIDLAGELGGGVMVFGSPTQRSSRGLSTPAEALERFIDGLSGVADKARAANSRILLEALSSGATDIVNTLEEVHQILQQINHPAIETVFDFHNVDDETLSWSELIHAYASEFTHVHLNEPDGSAPSPHSAHLTQFRQAFDSLQQVDYQRWVSLEIFSVPEDPAAVLRDVRAFLSQVAEREV